MREFFRPWRTKIGVLTLGLACLFALGWVRSLSTIDLFEFDLRGRGHSISTVPETIRWEKSTEHEGRRFSGIRWMEFEASDIAVFFFLQTAQGGGIRKSYCEIRYPYIVIPLTALSIFLLMKKPRQSTQPKASPSIQGELTRKNGD